jgi:hypothetical protein
VPRPPRGYWRRLEVGPKVRKSTLPSQPLDRPNTVTFDVQANEKRRKEWSCGVPPKSSEVGMSDEKWNVELTENEAELRPLAQRILR